MFLCTGEAAAGWFLLLPRSANRALLRAERCVTDGIPHSALQFLMNNNAPMLGRSAAWLRFRFLAPFSFCRAGRVRWITFRSLSRPGDSDNWYSASGGRCQSLSGSGTQKACSSANGAQSV